MNSPDGLLDAFERGDISNREFPHERHVRVAWGLGRRYPRDEAMQRLKAGILAIAERAGRPTAYHHTITCAWFELINSVDDLEAHRELFDKTLLNRYYSTARLAAGRDHWVEPDLHPLRLPPPAPASADLRGVFSRVPSAVAVVAVHHKGVVHATTISSLTSVSLSPPLVSVCVANASRSLELIHDARSFALSVLGQEQADLAARFADKNRPSGPAQFAGVPHHLSQHGPVIDTAAAWLGCRLHGLHAGGDHQIVVGHVEAAEASDRHPLLRHGGAYH